MADVGAMDLDVSADLVLQSLPGPSLESVPNDVLLQIWTLLDNPTSLYLTSKRFAAFSKDPFTGFRWLAHHYTPAQVIFEAIARPKLFSVRLFELLVNNGAVVSRHLIQLLHALHNPPTLSRQGRTRWGCGVQFAAYLAVMEQGRRLYGDDLSFQTMALDDFRFETLLIRLKLRHGKSDEDQLRRLISQGRHVSLPLTFNDLRQPSDDDPHGSLQVVESEPYGAERAMLRIPSLAPLLRANGYQFTFEGSLYMCREIFARGYKNSTPESIFKDLTELMDQGVLQVSRAVASNILLGFRASYVEPATIEIELPSSRNELVRQGPMSEAYAQASAAAPEPPNVARVSYDALIMLEQKGKLAFSVVDVVRELVEFLDEGAVDLTMGPLLDKLQVDYPEVDLDSLFVQLTFLKVELARITDLSIVASMMGEHKVTQRAVMKACMRNGCRSVVAIQYAARYIENFDVEAFVAELVECILHQPYRGLMLRALDHYMATPVSRGSLPALAIDFRKILAKAVEQKSFSPSAIPAQEWSNRHLSQYLEVNRSHSVVRSLLAYDWKPRREHYNKANSEINEANPGASIHQENISKSHSQVSVGPKTLKGFTLFASPTHATSIISADSYSTQRRDDRVDAVHVARLQDIVAGKKADDAFRRNPCDDAGYEMSKPKYRAQTLERERYLNVLGPISDDDEPIATCIVSLLGPDCKAADVILSHSLATCNEELVSKLAQLGVVPTLEHYEIMLRVGNRASSGRMLDRCIENGARFKHSHAAAENVPRTYAVAPAFTVLSAEETERCASVQRGLPEGSATVIVDVDEANALHIANKPAGPRSLPVGQICITDVTSSPKSGASAEMDSSSNQLGINALEAGTEELHEVVSQSGYVPIVIDSKTLAQRIASVTLWKQHLELLMIKERKKYAAVRAAFSLPNAYQLNGAFQHVEDLIRNLTDLLRALGNAVPVPPTDAKADLKLLQDELLEIGGPVAAQQVWTDLNSALGGGSWRKVRQRPAKRRAFVRALWLIVSAESDAQLPAWPIAPELATLLPDEPHEADPDYQCEVDMDSSSDVSESEEEITDDDSMPESMTHPSPRKRSHEEITGQASNTTESHEATSRMFAGKAMQMETHEYEKASEEVKYPVYSHPKFDVNVLEHAWAQAQHLGLTKAQVARRYEDELMRHLPHKIQKLIPETDE